MTSQTVKSSNTGLLYGTIGGLAMIVFTLCLYLAGVQAFGNMMLGLLGYAIIITVAVLAASKQKQLNGRYLPFGTALKTVFTVFVLAFLLQTIFNYVLLNYIDTSFRDSLTQLTIEKTEALLRKFGAPESEIEKTLQSMGSADSYSIKNLFLGFGMMCIVSFLIALIIAAIVKKNKPAFEESKLFDGDAPRERV